MDTEQTIRATHKHKLYDEIKMLTYKRKELRDELINVSKKISVLTKIYNEMEERLEDY